MHEANDTVLLLASGRRGPADTGALRDTVAAACADLAEQMVRDAEGATKIVRMTVTGAVSDAEAHQGVRKVVDSVLVKCSWHGEDPYWGRIASELGSAGIAFDSRLVSVSYGGVVVADRGVHVAHDEEAVRSHMSGPHLEIVADLGIGGGTSTMLTNDLSHDYIDENMGTS